MEPSENDTIAILNSALGDASKLLNLHVELLRAEAKKGAVFTKRIAILGFLLILGLIPTLVLFAFGLSDLLRATTQMQEWQCKLVVAAICFSCCATLAYNARSQLLQLQDR